MPSHEQDTGFIIVTSDWPTQRFKEKIAHFSGIHPTEVDEKELKTVVKVLQLSEPELRVNDEQYATFRTMNLEQKYLDKVRQRTPNSKYVKVSDQQQLFQLEEGLSGNPLVAASYGAYFPTYLSVLAEYKKIVNKDTDTHTGLLVGALTPDTAREYAIAMRTTFSDSECIVLDLFDHFTHDVSPELATYREGSALSMPFSDNSFDSLQTNLLLRHMYSPNTNYSRDAKRQQFFQEAYRVLKPGGLLLMIEDADLSPITLNQELQEVGFLSPIMGLAQHVDQEDN